MGTALVMFVAERPATVPFSGPGDYLYALLEKSGAADCQLTDVIKSRGKVGEPHPEDMSPDRRVFDREIEIGRIQRLVAQHQEALLRSWDAYSNG